MEEQYIKMTETPVNKLVLELGIPTIISMLVTNIYNVVDTLFVSQIGTSASGATGVVFALMAVLQAIGFMLGHGAGSNISRRLGARKIEEARKFASTSFYLSILLGAVVMAFGLLFLTPFMKLLGSTDTILPYAESYATFILLAAPGFTSSCVMNNILRYEGKAFYAMLGLTAGGVLNIFGDWYFMYVFHMGIAGAGLSTCLSQYVSMIILLLPFLRGVVQSRFSLKYFTKDMADIVNIIMVGFPSFARQGLNSISVMILNSQAAAYGDAAIAAMSISTRIVSFLFCVGLGIGQGFQPVSAFNYGAGKYDRVRKALTFTLVFGIVTLGIFSAGGYALAPRLIRIFRDDPEVLDVGVTALRAECLALVIMPVSVCGNMLFQSIGKSGRATFLACLRSGLCFIPILLLLAKTVGLFGIEIAQPVADVLASLVTIPFMVSFLRKLKEKGK